MRRRGQDDHIHLVDHVLVGVEPRVLSILGHVHPRGRFRRPPALEGRQALVETIRKGIGHGDEPGVLVGIERLFGRACAAAAAADQTDPQGVAPRGMDVGHHVQRRGRRGRQGCRLLHERAARGLGVSHQVVSSESKVGQASVLAGQRGDGRELPPGTGDGNPFCQTHLRASTTGSSRAVVRSSVTAGTCPGRFSRHRQEPIPSAARRRLARVRPPGRSGAPRRRHGRYR